MIGAVARSRIFTVVGISDGGDSGGAPPPPPPPATPPQPQAFGTVATANSASSLTVGWPTHVAGDVGVLVVVGIRGSNPYAAPTDWTEVASSPQADAAAAGNTRLHLFWRRATSDSETSPVVADIASDGNKIGQIITFRGCIATGNPINISAGDATAGTGDTAVAIPGATTTIDQCLVVAVCGHTTIDLGTGQFTDFANASLDAFDEIDDVCNTIGTGFGFGVGAGVKVAAGAYSVTTATLSAAVTQARISFALLPVPV